VEVISNSAITGAEPAFLSTLRTAFTTVPFMI
jgi:hypothetical protein